MYKGNKQSESFFEINNGTYITLSVHLPLLRVVFLATKTASLFTIDIACIIYEARMRNVY